MNCVKTGSHCISTSHDAIMLNQVFDAVVGQTLGGISIQRWCLTISQFSIINIKQSWDYLIFIMGNCIPGKTVFILKQVPVFAVPVSCIDPANGYEPSIPPFCHLPPSIPHTENIAAPCNNSISYANLCQLLINTALPNDDSRQTNWVAIN